MLNIAILFLWPNLTLTLSLKEVQVTKWPRSEGFLETQTTLLPDKFPAWLQKWFGEPDHSSPFKGFETNIPPFSFQLISSLPSIHMHP